MANAPDAARALEAWKTLEADRAAGRLASLPSREALADPQCPFDLGVHLNLTQGRPLNAAYPAELLDSAGCFPGVFSLFRRLRRGGDRFRAAIRAELEQQIQFVCDHGLRPTHLNGHQYIEMLPPVTALLPELLKRFSINVLRVAWERSLFHSTFMAERPWTWPMAVVKRAFAGRFRSQISAMGIGHPNAVFFGTAHAGRMNLRLLRLFLAAGRNDRVVEIGLHPGEAAGDPSPNDLADGWHDPLASLRPNELRLLISADLPGCLEAARRRLGRLATDLV